MAQDAETQALIADIVCSVADFTNDLARMVCARTGRHWVPKAIREQHPQQHQAFFSPVQPTEAGQQGGRTEGDSKKKRKGDRFTVKDLPNFPKRPKTSYFLWMEDYRNRHKAGDASAAHTTTTDMARIWKQMTPEEREPFEKMSQKNLQSYEQEKALFIEQNKNHPLLNQPKPVTAQGGKAKGGKGKGAKGGAGGAAAQQGGADGSAASASGEGGATGEGGAATSTAAVVGALAGSGSSPVAEEVASSEEESEEEEDTSEDEQAMAPPAGLPGPLPPHRHSITSPSPAFPPAGFPPGFPPHGVPATPYSGPNMGGQFGHHHGMPGGLFAPHHHHHPGFGGMLNFNSPFSGHPQPSPPQPYQYHPAASPPAGYLPPPQQQPPTHGP